MSKAAILETGIDGGGAELPPSRHIGGAEGEDFDSYVRRELTGIEMDMAEEAVRRSGFGMYTGELATKGATRHSSVATRAGKVSIHRELSIPDTTSFFGLN